MLSSIYDHSSIVQLLITNGANLQKSYDLEGVSIRPIFFAYLLENESAIDAYKETDTSNS